MPKEVSRNVFVRRINEINASYLKQKKELAKILGDVEQLQKTIHFNNTLCERYSTEIENQLKSVRNYLNITNLDKLFYTLKKVLQNQSE